MNQYLACKNTISIWKKDESSKEFFVILQDKTLY